MREAAAAGHVTDGVLWMDTLPVIQACALFAAQRLLASLRADSQALAFARCCSRLWLTWPGRAVLCRRRDEPAGVMRGWQRRGAHACDERALDMHIADLSPASRGLLLPQAGPDHIRPEFSRFPHVGRTRHSRLACPCRAPTPTR